MYKTSLCFVCLRFSDCLRSALEPAEEKRCVKDTESDERAVYRRRRRRERETDDTGSDCSVRPQSDSEQSNELDCELRLFS